MTDGDLRRRTQFPYSPRCISPHTVVSRSEASVASQSLRSHRNRLVDNVFSFAHCERETVPLAPTRLGAQQASSFEVPATLTRLCGSRPAFGRGRFFGFPHSAIFRIVVAARGEDRRGVWTRNREITRHPLRAGDANRNRSHQFGCGWRTVISLLPVQNERHH